jgi:hypothetical protein
MNKSRKHPKPRKGAKRGPKPEHLKIDMDWEKAMSIAMKKKKPMTGWPKS